MKKYLLVRWKKRWPIVPAAAIFTIFCRLTVDHTKAHGCLLVAAFLVVVVILFPFHWGGEDWDEN